MTMSQAAQMGYANAESFAAWEANFIAGRFLNGDNGYNPLEGTAYYLNIADPNASTVTLFNTWAQAYSSTYGGQPTPTALDGYPEWAGGYAANAKAALASLYDVTHSADVMQAYTWITQQSPHIVNGSSGYASDQTWDITPTLKDGHHLLNTEISFVAPNSNVTAVTDHSMMIAASGNNVLHGGDVTAILMGGTGADSLIGGHGDDYLFAGSGGDHMEGNAGTNVLVGGAGADAFIFNAADTAHDSVAKFQAGVDTLDIHGLAANLMVADLVRTATANSAGDAVLHLSAQHDVTLEGIHVNELDAHWIHVS